MLGFMNAPSIPNIINSTNLTIGVDPKLLEILVCPVTKVPLRYDAARQELISDQAHLAYPIRGQIPIMLAAEARELPD